MACNLNSSASQKKSEENEMKKDMISEKEVESVEKLATIIASDSKVKADFSEIVESEEKKKVQSTKRLYIPLVDLCLQAPDYYNQLTSHMACNLSSSVSERKNKRNEMKKDGIGELPTEEESEECEEQSESEEQYEKQPMSAYELMIKKKREERKAILQSLKVYEAKAGFCEVLENVKKKEQPVKRVFKKVEKPTELRKSKRLANVKMDFSEASMYFNALKRSAVTGPPKIQQKETMMLPPLIQPLQSDEIPPPPTKRNSNKTDPKRKFIIIRKESNICFDEALRKINESFKTLNNALKRKEIAEDECDLYGKLLTKKLRKYPEGMRDCIMYKIDSLLLDNPPDEHPSSSSSSYFSQSTPSPHNMEIRPLQFPCSNGEPEVILENTSEFPIL